MPLYVENDEAERILTEAGSTPYADDEWQLVQTHLIFDTGDIQELWRPGPDSGASDAVHLAAALDTAIGALALEPKPPLPAYRNPRLDVAGDDGLLMRVVLRFPVQKALTRQRTYAVDWITLTEDEVKGLLPPAGANGETYDIHPDLAAEVMIHFRPPLDTAQDLDDEAMKILNDAVLKGKVIGESGGVTYIGLAGGLSLVRPPWKGPIKRQQDKWTELKAATVKAQGYLAIDTATQAVVDAKWETTDATLIPPDGKQVHYEGVASMERESSDD